MSGIALGPEFGSGMNVREWYARLQGVTANFLGRITLSPATDSFAQQEGTVFAVGSGDNIEPQHDRAKNGNGNGAAEHPDPTHDPDDPIAPIDADDPDPRDD